MAFLQLNGVTINVGEGASNSIRTTGASETNIGGGHYQDIRYRKRTWTFTTTPYTEMEALAYAGLIRGEGQLFTMDDTSTSTKNVEAVSDIPTYSTTVPTGFSGKSLIHGSGTDCNYPVEIFKAQQDLTFNVWTDTAAATGADEFLVNIYKTNFYQNSFRVYRTSSDNYLNFAVSAIDSSGDSDKQSILRISDPFDGSFKMVTAVLRRNRESDESTQYLYINGVVQSVGDTTAAYTPDPSSWTDFKLGKYPLDAANKWPDRLDDVQVLPYAAPASMILGWYNFGQNSGQHPNLKMTGDITNDSLVTVRGEVESVSYTFVGGRTRQQISFTLTEV